ncbi:purine-binding chemotaxis protein CheW [Clostridium sp. 19966]|uniref:chemotaxis protein CheW n=1 Tax=Clostridium sp. 19966 TaxID=2768166 RepID=UPI0028DE7BC4|nr:chemotaxis protein CheW [Clostridium sp. 19966]MDT8716678.1 purine-binding chemotaxis protein CheW [Clostridium sp. 19966]
MQIIIFKLNEELFAVETSKVQGIENSMEITKVPTAPGYIKGLINLRGNVISLLDIDMLLDINKLDKEKNSIIILNMNEELVGIAVDDVSEVMEISDKKIEKVQEDRTRPYIKGVINLEDNLVTLVDVDELKLN